MMKLADRPAHQACRWSLRWWIVLFCLGFFALSAAARPELARLKEVLELSGYPAGWQPPPLSGVTSGGQKVSLAGSRGRVLLITFWATWCPPCREEMPAFEQLHRDYGPKGLLVLGVNVGEQVDRVVRYGKKLELTFPLVMDPSARIGIDYGVTVLPTAFLIGRDGRPVGLAVGERNWNGPQARKLIELLLDEAPNRGAPERREQ